MARHSARFYFIVIASITWAFLFSIWFFVYKAPLPRQLRSLTDTWQFALIVILLLLATTIALYLRGRRKDISRIRLFLRVTSNIILVVGLVGLVFLHWTSPGIITLVFGAFVVLRGFVIIQGLTALRPKNGPRTHTGGPVQG
jgi:hypothetical protein